MADTKTTLHPEGDLSTNVYPDVLSDNIPSSAVTSSKIADSAVTSSKIADSAVTSAKLADSSVTSGKIADGAVSGSKLAYNPKSDIDGILYYYMQCKYEGVAYRGDSIDFRRLDTTKCKTWDHFMDGASILTEEGVRRDGDFSFGHVTFDSTSDLVSASYMFANWRNSTGVIDFKWGATLDNITGTNNFYGLFYRSTALRSFEVTEGGKLRVWYVAAMFHECTNLQSVKGIDMSAAISMDYLFLGCTSLATIECTGWKTSFSISDTALEHDALVTLIDSLSTVTTAQTLTMGDSKLALLSDEEKQVATDKGWTLA